MPNSPATASSGKAATLAILEHLPPVTSGRLADDGTRCVLPERRASRLDDPPEIPPFA